MAHPTLHFTLTLAIGGAVIALMFAVRNPVIRRRLLFTVGLLGLAAALHWTIRDLEAFEFTSEGARGVDVFLSTQGWKLEALLIVYAIAQALVTLIFNPWRPQARDERAPAIVQDAIIAVLLAAGAVMAFGSAEFLTTSAIVAAVVGFALQETLGNAFAGLAIQIERPFRVGHWIAVGNYEGTVKQITWRATKIRTKSGNLVVVPNNVVARESINNYSEPIAPTRLQVDVGVTYNATPNEVKAAMLAAIQQASSIVLASPKPDVLMMDFGNSAIVYRARFWIDDFEKDSQAMSEVRTKIYYEFGRRGIEIPYPIQVEYSREDVPLDLAGRRERFQQTIAHVPVLAVLPVDAHRALAAAASERLFGDGETIVHEGDAGGSMFIVCRGRVVITIGPANKEVAVTEAGGFFGEMSALTGSPRTATVRARGDSTVLEIPSDAFGVYIRNNPQAIDALATVVAARRAELDVSRGGAAVEIHAASISLASRIRSFFGLS